MDKKFINHVSNLVDGSENILHYVYMNNIYNGVELAKKYAYQKNQNVWHNRKNRGIPVDLRNWIFRKRQDGFRRKGDVVIHIQRDKRAFRVITTIDEVKMIEIGKKERKILAMIM